ncbi:MAG: hypothetical protein FWD02_01570 [Bacteroidales bacterium]|nr:hypothetical protein [Bacteroidales bacterium]
MIDNVKITLYGFSGSFKNCEYVRYFKSKKFGYEYNGYRLNRVGSGRTHLEIREYATGRMTIKGSLKKWYFKGNTRADLTKSEFIEVLEIIAKKLKIPFDEICRGAVTNCEIGQTVKIGKTKDSVDSILRSLVAYGDGRLRRKQVGTTVYFLEKGEFEEGKKKDRTKSLKIYDKVEEILVSKDAPPAEKRRMETFQKLGIKFLRIEFTLNNKRAFRQSGLRNVNTLGDLITYFSNLYEFWAYEIKRITVYSALDEKKMSAKDIAFMSDLKKYEYPLFVEMKKGTCESDTEKGLKSAKSKVARKINNLIVKNPSMENFRRTLLRWNVLIHLQRKRKRGEEFLFLAENLFVDKEKVRFSNPCFTGTAGKK